VQNSEHKMEKSKKMVVACILTEMGTDTISLINCILMGASQDTGT
jgi:hypothetical protein